MTTTSWARRDQAGGTRRRRRRGGPRRRVGAAFPVLPGAVGERQWAHGELVALVALVALATGRAAPFYRAAGYEESAAYFRKVLPGA